MKRMRSVFDPYELEVAIVELCAARGADARICPLDAAREFAGSQTNSAGSWHDFVPGVRRAALSLANSGRLTIYSGGRAADPAHVRGDYRFALARFD